MPRIHDALARARGEDLAAQRPSDDPFLSPWIDGAERPAVPPDEPHAAPPAAPPQARFYADVAMAPDRIRLPLQERFDATWQERLTIHPHADRCAVEQFRRLAATLVHRQRADGIKSVMVASANPSDGKTLTALNLALVLSESYRQRVLLVDGDLRRAAIGNAIDITGIEGLNEAIKAAEERQVSLVELTRTLTVLPAGVPTADPLSALTSSRMARLLDEAAGTFDWVIVDSPPAGATADATLLCAMVDAVILVIRAGQTPHAAVTAAIEALGRDRIHGVVLNGVEDRVARAVGGEYSYR